jgi:gluconokinase
MTTLEKHIQSPLVLALDIGSSSIRATLYDAQLEVVPDMQVRINHELQTTRDGGAYLDPDFICQQMMVSIDRLLEIAGEKAGQIVGVGSSNLVANVVGVDKSGRAMTPLYTWADTRDRQAVAWLRDKFDEPKVHQRTGCLFHTSYLPARLRWLQTTQFELYQAVDRWLSLDDYLRLQLFGQTSTSYSIASWTGLFDRFKLRWDLPLLSELDISMSKFPLLVDSFQKQSGLLSSFVQRWPAIEDTPWYPALGDGAASNLGSGGTSSENLVINIGTSAAARVIVPGTPSVPPGLWCYRLNGQSSLLGGAVSNAGNLFNWLLRTLHLGSLDEIERELAGQRPDAHQLTMLPFLAGERAPGWATGARGAIVGLGLHTQPIDIVRASLDAVAYRLALIHDLIDEVMPNLRQIIISGGGAVQSKTWMQMLSDLLDREVNVMDEAEASSRGAAIAVFQALGYLENLDSAPMPAIKAKFSPDSERHRIYRAAMGRHLALYRTLVNPNPTI